MSGKHLSRYKISQPTFGQFQVHCPGAELGLCIGHNFNNYSEARRWVTESEEGK